MPRLHRTFLARVFLHGVALVAISIVAVLFVVITFVSPTLDRNAVDMGLHLAPPMCAMLSGGKPYPLHDTGALGGVLATLFESDGTIVASTAKPPFPNPTSDTLASMRRDGFVVLRSGRALAAFPCDDGSARYIALGHPENLPLSLLGAAALVVLVVVSLGSLPLARSVVAPLNELVVAAKRIGRGDLETRVDSARNDEIGDLGRAFDEMTSRLRRLVAAEKELLANVSHELRTPLARIRVVLEIAEENPARAQTLLGQIGIDLADLERLVEDVMDAMRLDVGASALGRAHFPLRLERTSLHELVEGEVTRQRSIHPTRVFEVTSEGGTELEADPRLLRRVIDNLLQNAVKYSEGSSVIEVRIGSAAGVVELAIVDHGVGIDPTDLANVFRPFFRGDKSRTRGTGGAGLGLALAKRVCEVHGGAIEVDSTVGIGTTMRVRLPRAG